MEKELVLLIGCIGSGKSTFCSAVLKDHLRISQDVSGKEGHFKLFLEALKTQDKIAIDRMNFNKYQRHRYIVPGRSEGFRIKFIWLKTPEGLCLERVIARKNHETVPENNEQLALKIINMYNNKFEYPNKQEYDELVIV